MLGQPDLSKRQHPVSFDKMEETPIHWRNHLLGRNIDTRSLMVVTPAHYVQGTVAIIKNKWHRKRRRFLISDLEELTGRLGYISETVPWLRFMMAHLYASSAHALGLSKAHLINTRKEFREMLKLLKQQRVTTDNDTKASCDTSQSVTQGNCILGSTAPKSDDREKRHRSYLLSITAKTVFQHNSSTRT